MVPKLGSFFIIKNNAKEYFSYLYDVALALMA